MCVWVVCECLTFQFCHENRKKCPRDSTHREDMDAREMSRRGELVASAFPHPIAAPHSRNLHAQEESSSGSVKASDERMPCKPKH